MLRNLKMQVLPEPEVRGQEVEELARRVIGRCFLLVRKHELLPIAVLVTKDDRI